ncbi:MAG: hypothetical protein C0513_03875 [Isosphaera sp.]|nr:hypothetical protein [Isosphaera sp.]
MEAQTMTPVLLAVGAWPAGHLAPTLALTLGPLQFDRPGWLWLLVPVGLAIVWIGRRSLSGLRGTTRAVALVVRLVVVLLILLAMAEPSWRRDSRDVAIIGVIDVSRSRPTSAQPEALGYIERAPQGKPTDRVGLVTVARDALPHSRPRPIGPGFTPSQVDIRDPGPTDSTNLESGVRLALALRPEDAATRIALFSDGNETAGSLLQAAQAARAAGVPIDVVPARFTLAGEVIAERLLAPSTARSGESATLRLVLNATRAATGRVTLLIDGQPVALDQDDQLWRPVQLRPGLNVQTITVKLPPRRGPVRFEALFEPDSGASGDTLLENNRTLAVTFVGGQGRVLVLTNKTDQAQQLQNALAQARIESQLRPTQPGWASLQELGTFECVVLVNTPAHDFSLVQQEELKSYVHDLGGGLVVIGGDDAFGAGGWIGSPLADALPIRLDVPNRREIPRGALMLIMHSCEVPEGNFWGRRTAEAAIGALSSKDLAGIVEFSWNGGNVGWVHPLEEVGDKSSHFRAIGAMSYGDAPDFHSLMSASLDALKPVAAGQKHVIIISDGDPSPPSNALIQNFIDNKVTVSTVAVFPHDGPAGSPDNMRRIAEATGGAYHEVTVQEQLATLPEIFIKEAKTVKRSLIWEGQPFSPALSLAGTEPMRGVPTPVPPISGYVVASDRQGLSQVVLRGQENDPVLAQWQHGLGRVVTFTSDATGKWAGAWVAWEHFRAFWEQHVRWAMRPEGSPNIRVSTSDRADRTVLIVEALDQAGDRLDFLRWQGSAVAPDFSASPVRLTQVGPGRYEGAVETPASGTYTVGLTYEQSLPDGSVVRGSAQAAVSRPFSDEYRALTDNAALLEQVAKLTGGRVLPPDPARAAQLWSPEGVTVPRSRTPVWLAVALIAIGAFLADVGVRRVRLDVRAMSRAVAGLFSASRSARTANAQALRAARSKAQRRAASGTPPGAQPRPTPAKFHASDAELAAASTGPLVDQPAAPVVSKPAQPASDQAQPGQPGQSGLARLRKAKERAQGEISDQ